jgi:hypothetical protein
MYRNFKVSEKVGTPFRVYHFLILNLGDRLKPAPTKSCGFRPPNSMYRNFKVFLIVGTPFRVYHFLILNLGDRLKPAPT